MRICLKCKKEIPDESIYCLYCGKKQVKSAKQRARKRPHGTGTIHRNSRYKNPWTAYAPNQHGKRVYLGSYSTAKQAQEAIDVYIRNHDTMQDDFMQRNMTLQEVYEKWSEIHYRQVSQNTINLYTSMWKCFSEIQQLPICQIKTIHFQKIIHQANSRSACYAIRTLANMLCRYAVENDVIQKNYAAFIQIPAFEKSEKKIFTKEDIALLWEHAEDKRVQIILFMIYTGLRIGELAMLRVSDIHLQEGYLICGEKTKAGRNRVVPFPENVPEISEFVQQWMQESVSENLLGLTTHQIRQQYFYPALSDLKLVTPVAKQHGRYIFEAAHYTPHSTRHTFASLSASVGMHPEHLQKIIGHANYSTTAEIYIHKNISELKSEMRKIKK